MDFLNTISYFLIEIICLLAIAAVSLCLNKPRRWADFITVGALSVNSLILAAGFLKTDFESMFYNKLFAFGLSELLMTFLINIFMLSFILVTYKIIRKAAFKTPLLNLILLAMVFLSSLLIKSQNFILTYFLLSLCSYLIYFYVSNYKLEKGTIYNFGFFVVSTLADFLFISFLTMTVLAQDVIQMDIIQVCITLSFFLKIGIFPIYNYSLNGNYRVNVPYSVLIYSFLPFLGVVSFNKLSEIIAPNTNEIYQITLVVFLLITGFIYAINSYKAKDLVKFISNSSAVLYTIALISVLILSTNFEGIKLAAAALIGSLGLYSLVCVLKSNLKVYKINISMLRNIFFNNRFFAFCFSSLLLIFCGVVPSSISKNLVDIFSKIYIFDKTGVYIVFITVGFLVLILFNSLRIIEKCYEFNRNTMPKRMTKRTPLNYAVLFEIIIFLILGMFL